MSTEASLHKNEYDGRGGAYIDSGEGLRESPSQMSLKSRLQVNELGQERRSGRLNLRELTNSGDLVHAESAGEALRMARLRLGLEVSEIAAQINIRQAHLEAMEEDDDDRLPGRTYVLGFLRTYATFLSLDPEETVALYKSKHEQGVTENVGLPFNEESSGIKVPQGSMLVLAVLLMAGLYGGWHLSVSADRIVTDPDWVPSAPERAVAENETPPLDVETDAGKIIDTGNNAAPQETAMAETVADSVGGPSLEVAPDTLGSNALSQAAVSAQVMIRPPADASSLVTVSPESLKGGRVFGDMGVEPRIILRARSKAWMRVEDADNQVLIQQELLKDDIYHAPDQEGVILSVRDASAFDLILDGKLVGQLGRPGQVLPSVSLDPEMIVLFSGQGTR